MQTFIFSMWIKFGFRGRSYTDGWEKHSSFSSVLQLLNLSVKCRICSAVNLSQRWRIDVLKVKQGLGVHASKWTGWTNWNCWVRWILCWFSLFPVIADSVRKFKILFYFLNFFQTSPEMSNAPVVRFSTIHQSKTSKAAHPSVLFTTYTWI